MAARYWVGGTNNWTAVNTSNWSTTSGGGGGASVPTASDDVYINTASGGYPTVTLGTGYSATVLSLNLSYGTLNFNTSNLTASTVTLTGTNSRSLAFGTGTLNVTGNNATVFNAADGSNMSVSGTRNVVFTYAGSTGTRVITAPSLSTTSASTAFNISFTNSATDTVSITGVCGNVSYANFAGTVTNTTRGVFGNLTYANTATFTAGANVTTIYPPASTQVTLTTNGVNTTYPLSINGSGNVALVGNYVCNTASTNSTLNLDTGNLLLNGSNLDIWSFNTTSANTRGIVRNSSNINLWGTTGTIINAGVMYGFTNYDNLTFNIVGNSAVADTRTVLTTSVGESQAFNINTTTGTGTFNIAAASAFNDIVFGAGYTGNLTTSDTTVFGNLTYSNAMTVTGVSGTTTFSSAAKTQTFTTQNKALAANIVCNIAYGNLVLAGNLLTANTNSVSLSAGNLNLNSYTANTGTFDSSSYNTRQLQFGATGNLILTANNTSILNIAIGTNFSYTGNATVYATYAGNTGARGFALGNNASVIATAALPLTITNAADTITVSGQFDDLNVANVTGTWVAEHKTLYGDYNVAAANATVVNSGYQATFAGINTAQAVNTANVDLGESYIVAASNTTVTLNGGLVSDYITLQQGNLNLNGQVVTANTFTSTSGAQRSLTTGAANVVITGTGTAWNVNSTNFTVSANTSTIKLTSTAANRTFAGGESLTYGNITLWGDTTQGTSTTFTGNITLAGTLGGNIPSYHDVMFTSGTTTTVNGWTLTGSAGNAIGISSNGFSTHNLVLASGNVVTDYLDITLSNASPSVGNVWYAGNNSRNLGRNVGWTFFGYGAVYDGDFFLVI